MALPAFSMRELIDAGVHFGHKTKRWNPRMAPFIYGTRNDVHIIDLQQTVPMLHRALGAVRSTALKNGRILFVGTKRQAADIVAEAATRCGQYYVNNRWLGGMLTNWQTIQNSIRQMRKIEETLAQGDSGLTKKERLTLQRQHDKLERSLGGIRDMGGKPDLLFVIDTNREEIAIKEAQTLGIPIVAIIDTNCTADGIDFPIPGNDDATRAIKLYCKLISDAALDGLGGREVDFASKKAKAPAEQAFLESTETEVAEAKVKPPQVKAEAAKPEAQERRPAREDRKGKKEAKATPAATTKKEAFAVEAKKAQAKKSDRDKDAATEAKATKKAPAKKSA
jgi:small subunit ribosomal protein S2